MSPMEKFFLVIAGIGGVLFLVKLALMFVGGDHGDTDAAGDGHGFEGHDSDSSFKLFSVQAITAFFLLFGLVGYACLHRSRLSVAWATGGGALAGLAAMLLVAWLFRAAGRLQSSGTLDLANAVGQEGAVYLRIPAGGTGKVQVTMQGRLATLDARSDLPEELKTGQRIRVVRVENNGNVTVEKA